MRIFLYILLVFLTFLAPLQRVNVGELEPVEAVFMIRKGNQLMLYTDTGSSGVGDSVDSAYLDLVEKTPAVVYLDTAEYLLLSSNAKGDIDAVRHLIKGSAGVCYFEEGMDIAEVVPYLNVHGHLPKLKHWNGDEPLPVLTAEKIIEKSEKRG